MTPQGLGPLFDRDAASLVLLAGMEGVFYTLYLRGSDGGKFVAKDDSGESGSGS
jgi:hypothetical protein